MDAGVLAHDITRLHPMTALPLGLMFSNAGVMMRFSEPTDQCLAISSARQKLALHESLISWPDEEGP